MLLTDWEAKTEFVLFYEFYLQFERLPNPSPRRLICVGFMVDKVVREMYILLVLFSFRLSIIPPTYLSSFSCYFSEGQAGEACELFKKEVLFLKKTYRSFFF
jgi:hypothetical protein